MHGIHEEFRRKAHVLNAGMPTLQYDRTRVKNLLVPMTELNPLTPLFERVPHMHGPVRRPAIRVPSIAAGTAADRLTKVATTAGMEHAKTRRVRAVRMTA